MFDFMMQDMQVAQDMHNNAMSMHEAAHQAAVQFMVQGTTDFDAHIASVEFLNESAIEVELEDDFDAQWEAQRKAIAEFDINDFSNMEV